LATVRADQLRRACKKNYKTCFVKKDEKMAAVEYCCSYTGNPLCSEKSSYINKPLGMEMKKEKTYKHLIWLWSKP